MQQDHGLAAPHGEEVVVEDAIHLRLAILDRCAAPPANGGLDCAAARMGVANETVSASSLPMRRLGIFSS